MKELLAFLGVSALVIVTPGQDTALTIRNSLLGNRQTGVATALGIGHARHSRFALPTFAEEVTLGHGA